MLKFVNFQMKNLPFFAFGVYICRGNIDKSKNMNGIIEFYAVNDQRSTAIKKGYSLRPLRTTTINAHELSMHVEQDSKIDHARVEYIMASVVKQVKEMVLNGHKVELGELGVIGLTCQGTGSERQEDVTVKKNVKGLKFTFRPSALLKDKMTQVQKTLVESGDGKNKRFDEHGALLITDKKDK